MLFRPVSFWQSALMTLPDGVFFDLMRSVLGTVKTPFNKQHLVEELSCFIARPEIQETLTAYINDHDRRIIAAVALLGEPAPGELESFFTGEYSYAELQAMLLNLEERLIIYRFRDTSSESAQAPLRIALNPRLETILSPAAADTSILFPSLEYDKGGAEPHQELNGRTLAALFAFLMSGEAFIKNEDAPVPAFRKKAAEESRRLFPGMDVEALAGGLVSLGVFVRNGEYLVPDEGKLSAFKSLSARDRLEYLAGGTALHFQQEASAKPDMLWNRSLLRVVVRIIHAVPGQVEPGKLLPEPTLHKLVELLRRKEEPNWGYPGLPDSQAGFSPSILLRAMTLAGLCSVTEQKGTRAYRFLNHTEKAGSGKPSVVVDSGFSCILYPEIGFADALDLAAFSTVEETGTAVRFTLSKDSVVRGFDRSLTGEQLRQLLERLSGGRVPDALKWNLDDWEKRWREVSLRQGTVLTLSGERSYLAQSGPLAPLVRETLAPGIYLLSVDAAEAAAALRNAGVDIVGRPGIVSGKASSPFMPLKQEAPAEDAVLADKMNKTARKPAEEQEDKARTIKEHFRAVLADMTLSKQDREELESRIERRIVLSESQLKDVSLRYEKNEARSLDYVGKTGVVKQAIASGSLVEVSCLGEEGRTILGNPESLDKKGGEMVLSLRPREGGNPVKIPLGKISLVRRIKQSIFGEA